MSDIVERLRQIVSVGEPTNLNLYTDSLLGCAEAADEIERLRAEVDRCHAREQVYDFDTGREPGVDKALALYTVRLKRAGPPLISLLYDADLLPEQIVSMRGAISLAAVVEAFELGQQNPAPDGEPT